MNFNLQKFSADVKEFRKANKLTQSEFAGKLELDNHTLVSLFEQGKRAPSKEVFANCNKIYYKIQELFYYLKLRIYTFLGNCKKFMLRGRFLFLVL